MAASKPQCHLAFRGEQGVWMVRGPPNVGPLDGFPVSDAPRNRALTYDSSGELMAYADGRKVVILTVSTGVIQHVIDRPRTVSLKLSPQGKVLAVWEPYITSKDIPAGTPNLQLYDVKSGQLLKAFMQKKQQGWAPQWTEDEAVCARNVNNEVHFFENNNFDNIVQKLHLQKVSEYSLPPKGGSPYHVAAYVPGAKGQPSFVRVYRYPNFGGPNSALANKSFYKADRVELIWNNKANALLLLTATDTSADSYYGEQGLHFVSTSGETCLVPRAKNGPVYSVQWNPKSTNFCVVYGFMPAKATLYNLKAEPVFDYGTGPRNVCYFNPQGNILCLAGFGNLNGNMEFWDVQNKAPLSTLKVPDATQFEWAPDGEHLMTATTSPRLRVGNGFKVWHYNGTVLYEENTPQGKELWEATWQPRPEGSFPPPKLSSRPGPLPAAQMPTTPGVSLANVQGGAYVPPHLRNNPAAAAATSSRSKFREDYEPASNVKQAQKAEENMSKQALKNKKKREAKKKKQDQERVSSAVSAVSAAPQPADESTGDPEKDKQIKGLRRKLQAIEKLKAKQAAGEKMELNQLTKLKTEDKLIEELEALTL